jgi:hypothetical protein
LVTRSLVVNLKPHTGSNKSNADKPASICSVIEQQVSMREVSVDKEEFDFDAPALRGALDRAGSVGPAAGTLPSKRYRHLPKRAFASESPSEAKGSAKAEQRLIQAALILGVLNKNKAVQLASNFKEAPEEQAETKVEIERTERLDRDYFPARQPLVSCVVTCASRHKPVSRPTAVLVGPIKAGLKDEGRHTRLSETTANAKPPDHSAQGRSHCQYATNTSHWFGMHRAPRGLIFSGTPQLSHIE